MKVILIGYRATGKSTAGALLSKKLRIPFVDTDRLIEDEAGKNSAKEKQQPWRLSARRRFVL
jgi:shikimate kinase